MFVLWGKSKHYESSLLKVAMSQHFSVNNYTCNTICLSDIVSAELILKRI